MARRGSISGRRRRRMPRVPDAPLYLAGMANRVMDVVLDSGLRRSQLLIQSFIPANLDVAKRRMPRVP